LKIAWTNVTISSEANMIIIVYVVWVPEGPGEVAVCNRTYDAENAHVVCLWCPYWSHGTAVLRNMYTLKDSPQSC
jgi:hypothetical protein